MIDFQPLQVIPDCSTVAADPESRLEIERQVRHTAAEAAVIDTAVACCPSCFAPTDTVDTGIGPTGELNHFAGIHMPPQSSIAIVPAEADAAAEADAEVAPPAVG